MPNILGVSAFYHDSAACLVTDGDIISAAQEERFTRKKHDENFPENAIKYCLHNSSLKARDLDFIAFYDKPFLKFERLLETYLSYSPIGIKSFTLSMPIWVRQKIWIKSLIASKFPGFRGKILFPEHHFSHAASAFYPSPFKESAILTVDGVGEWATTSIGYGSGNKIELLKEIRFPHSLGLLYSAFTYYTGFKVNSGEYKLMGLAPYGEPKYVQKILDNLVELKEDGSFRLNMKYFDFATGRAMINSRFNRLFGVPPRKPESPLTQTYMDIARSIQEVTELILFNLSRHTKEVTHSKHLCLAGGVALNCTANGKISRKNLFDDIWIQPAASDAGGALGAALAAWYDYLKNEREVHTSDFQKGSFLGPEFSDEWILEFLEQQKIPYQKFPESKLINTTAQLLAKGNVVGWFQGRMEFGPRALGSRSILGDARSPVMQRTLNLKIKYRESFRPLAPSVLYEDIADYFELSKPSPYMLIVADVKKGLRKKVSKGGKGIDRINEVRSSLPAITHIDYSARVQTVHKETNIRYWKLLNAFKKLTGCSVILNTSFNVRGEPIVCTPPEAYKCFMRTEMDYLVMGNFLLDKKQQIQVEEKEKFELD